MCLSFHICLSKESESTAFLLSFSEILVRYRTMTIRRMGNKSCTNCGGRLQRVHRTFRERVFFMAKLRCLECERITTVPRRFNFLLGKDSRCLSCGTYSIQRLVKRDHVDKLSKHPFSYYSYLKGGRVHWCPFCRLQYYDLRPPLPKAAAIRKTAEGV